MTDTRQIAPWTDPMGRTDTSIHSPGSDLADIAAARARIDEVARLLAFPSAAAEPRDIPGNWPSSSRKTAVAHRDPEGSAVLVRGRVGDTSINLREHVRMQVVKSPFLETFIVEEDVLPSGLNVPTHGGDDQPARLWFDRLRALVDALDARIRRHGRRAGDPYHEIGQTLEGKVAVRIREMIARTGTPNLSGLSFRLFAPSPYAPLDCHLFSRQTSNETPIAKLQPSLCEAWSATLGSTIEMRTGGALTSSTIVFTRASSTAIRADDVDSAMDAMRAVASFRNDLERPFLQVPRN
jgi:hypothetical protein